MDFGMAFDALRHGYKIARAGWDGNGMWLEMKLPRDYPVSTIPFIIMHDAQGADWPWAPSNKDLFSDDWRIFQ